MARSLISVVIGILFLAEVLPAQEGIQRGTLKKIDLDRGVLTLTVAGKDQDFLLTEQTQVPGTSGKDLKERLQGFKEGAEVFFKSGRKDGKDYLLGLKAVGDNRPAVLPTINTSRFKPLTELGAGEYQGIQGGLYPSGKNERPAAHEAAGLALAKQVQPLSADGKPNAEG